LLAEAGPRGCPETLMSSIGFEADMLASLVRNGLAAVQSETIKAGRSTIDVTRVRITDAGRKALAQRE
jgi:hypothetical protein